MKLPDFRDFVAFNLLKERMGIPLGYVREFHVSVDPGRLTAEELAKLARPDGIEITSGDLSFQKDGTLTFKNSRVLLYIRDVHSAAEPRFHVAHCQTLAHMLAEGRAERYVVSTALDGQFTIRVTHSDGREELRVQNLSVCQNCLDRLRFEGFRLSLPRQDRMDRVRKFSVRRFFELFPRSMHQIHPE